MMLLVASVGWAKVNSVCWRKCPRYGVDVVVVVSCRDSAMRVDRKKSVTVTVIVIVTVARRGKWKGNMIMLREKKRS